MSKITRAIKAAVREMNFGRVREVAVPAAREGDAFLGHCALVTGGSSGIGLEIARRLALEGCDVVIAGRDSDKLEQAKKRIGLERVRSCVLDVSETRDGIESAVDRAALAFGKKKIFDICVNAAGVVARLTPMDVDEREWDRVCDTNLRGSYFVSMAVARRMISSGLRGHILLLSSSSALRPGWGPYEISKWGVKGMALGLADLFSRDGIIVNALGPGPTATPMLGKGADEDITHPTNPSGRYATTGEIAELALVLLGNMGDMIVGDTLYATGGAGTISLDR
ncbi:MAG TPA: SDR family oxidoreductase [Candidatus Olsenella avistercoris]|nr:SDR family oxidoreductase [Candidatus Olsenella avistercoris]